MKTGTLELDICGNSTAESENRVLIPVYGYLSYQESNPELEQQCNPSGIGNKCRGILETENDTVYYHRFPAESE